MVRRANKKDKRKPVKKRRAIMLIGAEGVNKTERNYFLGFNRRQKNYRVIFAPGSDTDPEGIVKEVIRNKEENGLEAALGDVAYAVFDTDFGKEPQIERARKVAERNGIRLALSNPCFEVWLMLHFRYSTKGYYSNEDVHNDMSKLWPDYRKNLNSFERIQEKESEAIRNAEKLKSFHANTKGKEVKIEHCNPSTDVDRLVKKLIQNPGK